MQSVSGDTPLEALKHITVKHPIECSMSGFFERPKMASRIIREVQKLEEFRAEVDSMSDVMTTMLAHFPELGKSFIYGGQV